SVLAWLFLALLLLSLRGRAISSARWWMLSSHLRVTRAHLGITRHLVHPTGRSVSRTCSSPGSFAGVHFGLVSSSGSHMALISGLHLFSFCSVFSFPLKFTIISGPRFFSPFPRSRRSSGSFSGPDACALPIKFSTGFVSGRS